MSSTYIIISIIIMYVDDILTASTTKEIGIKLRNKLIKFLGLFWDE